MYTNYSPTKSNYSPTAIQEKKNNLTEIQKLNEQIHKLSLVDKTKIPSPNKN